jgi:glycosyltransferase involved in cell wall biosynthesis
MSESLPKFSVVVPTRDRFVQLSRCLEALVAQTYPADCYEVILVNDGSRSAVPPSILDFQNLLDLTIINRSESKGPGTARNAGANIASGQFLAFTDDDCTPASDWLQQLAEHFAAAPEDLVGGRVINALRNNPYSTAAHVILDTVYEYYDPRQGRAHFFPTSNFAMAAKSFAEVGGFSETWPLAAAEDRELCYRWIIRGATMSYLPQAIVYHRHTLNLRSFCGLHFKYGRGAYHYHLLRAGGPGEGGFAPAWKFYWRCFCYPWHHFPVPRALLLMALLVLWQGCNAIGYAWEQLIHPSRNSAE